MKRWEYSTDRNGGVVFSNGGIRLSVSGFSWGSIGESFALPPELRVHKTTDLPLYTVKSAARIPFGAEPGTRREFSALENIVRVTSDVHFPAEVSVSEFEADTFLLLGEWTELQVYSFGSHGHLEKGRRIDLGGSSRVKLDSIPPLVVIKSVSGELFETGLGFDLWRWWNFCREPGNGAMSFSYADGRLEVRRTLFESPNSPVAMRGNYRYNWYFATAGNTENRIPRTNNELGKVAPQDFLSGAKNALDENGEPCILSPSARKLLRTEFRRCSDSRKSMLLEIPPPTECRSSSHLKRGPGADMPHWTYPELINLNFWSRKISSGSLECLCDCSSWPSELRGIPSLKTLSAAGPE